ncbi:NTP transferase domain-containing protein [candidate division KSB1 bacterium]|nr:NTP transferase domain-containing protein [candidate division KSB1 bacterium]
MPSKPKAIILAAGYGTRLLPLTSDTPKALVTIGEKPLLQWCLEKLIRQGFETVFINVHYLADQVVEFVKRLNPPVDVYFSVEENILDTGGGIKRIVEQYHLNAPLLIHNVDVVSNLELDRFFLHHQQSAALATLAVEERHSKRYLLFNARNILCGRIKNDKKELVRPVGQKIHSLAFNGIQAADPAIFKTYEHTVFSSIDVYLRASAMNHSVKAYRMDGTYWRDIGTPETLKLAEKDHFAGIF